MKQYDQQLQLLRMERKQILDDYEREVERLNPWAADYNERLKKLRLQRNLFLAENIHNTVEHVCHQKKGHSVVMEHLMPWMRQATVL